MKKILGGLGTVFLSMALTSGTVNAELSLDTHIQRDDHVRLDIDRTTYEEFKRYYDTGYPAASVMLHGITLGMPIEDVVYLATLSDPGRAEEFYQTAVAMAPSLPGWVCRSGRVSDRYMDNYSLNELGPQPTIAQVAQEWFENNRALAPFPDWQRGMVHMDASVAELATLVGDQKYWYQEGRNDGSPIFVGLYRDQKEIVIGGDVRIVSQAQQQGLSVLPVMIVYNQEHQRPLSRYPSDVTVKQLSEEFFSSRTEITPVVEWSGGVGDFHKWATLEEMREVIDFPGQGSVPADEWAAIVEDIKANGGVNEPVKVTLLRSDAGEVWVDNPAVLTAAENLGISQVPVVLFYHDLDRQPCGAPSTCTEQICSAMIAAGGSAQICTDTPTDQPVLLQGGGGGVLPPVSP